MAKKFNSIWPPPVYVGMFSNGETVRMSFSTRAGKPLDFERGRRIVCWIKRDQRVPLPPNCRAILDGQRAPSEADGYFESVEYRKLLRHYAQKLVNAVVTDLCGSPMPIRRKRYVAGFDRDGKPIRKVALLGWGSIPLFRTRLPECEPATDIVDGWVEKGDETFPDPFFAPQASAEVIELPRKRRVQSDLEKALALLARLSAGDRAVLAERIAA
jgi:hypothetical protein